MFVFKLRVIICLNFLFEAFDLVCGVLKKPTSVLDLSRVKISDHYMQVWRNWQMRWLRAASRQCNWQEENDYCMGNNYVKAN